MFLSQSKIAHGAIKFKPETNPMKSVTVPNQSMSIREIIQRFSLGQSVSGAREVYYDDEEDFDNVDPTLDPNFDLSDYTRLKEETEISLSRKKKHAERAAVGGTMAEQDEDAQASVAKDEAKRQPKASNGESEKD